MTSWARNGREFSQLSDHELTTVIHQSNMTLECGPGETGRKHCEAEIAGARAELALRERQLEIADERNHVPAGAVMLTTNERELIREALDLSLHAVKIYGGLNRPDSSRAVERVKALIARLKP